MSKKDEQLSQIARSIIDESVCSDLAAKATQLVFGVGSPNAQIVFIGEAPGKNEDLKGEPFVGAAGKFLNEMLEMIGLKRSDVYITNIVKYRPPGNRDPLPDEKLAFMPYLAKQLEVIKPKLTVLLGRHAMSSFFPKLRITEVHGKTIRDGAGRLYLALYHPAAALYNGSMKQTLINDFQKISKILNKL